MPTVDGLASGINTTGIINQLLDLSRGPIRSYQSRIGNLEFRKSRLQDLNGLLSDLKTAVAEADTTSEISVMTASSSSSSAVTASVTGEALPGSYEIGVAATAKSTLLQSNGFADLEDTLWEGDLSITVGGDTTVVPMSDAEGTRTIEGLADYINENVEGATAYVLDTGAAVDPYQLIIEGDDTGLDNAVSTSVTLGADPGVALSFSSLRSAQDAEFDIDGITIFSDSNTISGVLPGLDLELKSVTTSDATVTVNRDNAAMAERVSSVVDAYNKLTDFITRNTGPDADPAFAGDRTLRQVQRKLQSVMSASYDNETTISGLGQLGIGTDNLGKMTFDTADFSASLSAEFADTIATLSGEGGLFAELYEEVDTIVDTTTGLIQPRINSIDEQVDDLNDDILNAEYRLEKYETTLRGQFTAMETLVARYQAVGTYLAEQLVQSTSSNS